MDKNAKAVELTNRLITLSARRTQLMIELKESLLYEQATYHLVKPDKTNYYMLFQIANKQRVADGRPANIKSYLRLRKIDPKSVYNIDIIAI